MVIEYFFFTLIGLFSGFVLGVTYWKKKSILGYHNGYEDGYEDAVEKEIEAWMVENLGEEYFRTPKEDFITLPKNMTASEYREWRKSFREQSIRETISDNYEALEKLEDD